LKETNVESLARRRKPLRLKGYDYSQAGAYFVTICAKDRKHLFGRILGETMEANTYGHIVEESWRDIPNHGRGVELDEFILMPNHIHGIVVIFDDIPSVGVGSEPVPTKRHSLSEIIRGFKTFSARRINEIRATPGTPVWQRGFFEHIIRNEKSLTHIREYITSNPQRWMLDKEIPDHQGDDRADGELPSIRGRPFLTKKV
jgi:REP element-mobilizing transposase RayT